MAAIFSCYKGAHMRINKKLIEAAGFNPTKESRQRSIFDLCGMIEKDEISLPLYQRTYGRTWKYRFFYSLSSWPGYHAIQNIPYNEKLLSK